MERPKKSGERSSPRTKKLEAKNISYFLTGQVAQKSSEGRVDLSPKIRNLLAY